MNVLCHLHFLFIWLLCYSTITDLSRSASLSEKELKEARTKSQIIAAQLQANSNSKGVQLFNRRRQRVNAFTFVSVGGGGLEASKNVIDSSFESPQTWDKRHLTEDQDKELNHRNFKTGLTWSAGRIHSTGSDMEDASEVTREDVAEESSQDRHFLPVNEKDEELSEDHTRHVKDEVTLRSDSNPAVMDRTGKDEDEAEANGAHNKETQNGYSAQCNGKADKMVTKQPTIINRTARPFFSPTSVGSSEATSPVMDIPPAHDSTTHFEPSTYPMHSRPVFSPPPPPPSYPTPPLPSYSSPPPPNTGHAPSPQPSSYCIRPYAPRPTFVPDLLSEKRSVTPIKTGILDEGRARRATRKSMFTFQEKPKVAPNPELLSMVQCADEKKKKTQPDAGQEEELLALGAEASNFLAKEEDIHEEARMPEWASSLKSSRTRARIEHKPEQALTNVSGKGAELFAKRQSKMERYVHDSKDLRSPSPTMSLPPSWVYPSNMPGRVKAIANSSNISAQISKTLQTQKAIQKKTVPAIAPTPPEIPLENGCTKIEMELSKHQPYQLNSSLFIFSPTKDPYSILPRGASAPKPVVKAHSYSRQSSLPTSPLPSLYSPSAAYRSAHCFSPPMTPLSPITAGSVSSPVSSLAPERVASPRSGLQAPRPMFSTKKSGISPQVWKPSSFF